MGIILVDFLRTTIENRIANLCVRIPPNFSRVVTMIDRFIISKLYHSVIVQQKEPKISGGNLHLYMQCSLPLNTLREQILKINKGIIYSH